MHTHCDALLSGVKILCSPAWSVAVFFQQNIHFRQSHSSEEGVTGEGEKPLTRFCASQSVLHKEHSRSDRLRVERRERKRDKRGEERLLGDSLASLPDLDHHQTLCI